MGKLIWGVAVLLSILLPSTVRAQVIEFDSVDYQVFEGPFGESQFSHLEDGFLVQWSLPTYAYSGSDQTLEVNTIEGSSSFYIRSADGGRFSLDSIDFGVLPGPFTADLQDGYPVANSFLLGYSVDPGSMTFNPQTTLNLVTGGLTTYSPRLDNILLAQVFLSVGYPYGTGRTFNVDNITLNSAVPEPSTWTMLLIGFGATGFAIRRRRRSNAHPQIA